MHQKSLKTKLIAIFLVAFVCLNAGGAMCVAYCQSTDKPTTAGADHCPLKKKARHCDPSNQDQNESAVNSFRSNEIGYCPMTVSFIAGPIEQKIFSFETVAAPSAAKAEVLPPVFFGHAGQPAMPAYRGPPLDQRPDRLKRCIIRI